MAEEGRVDDADGGTSAQRIVDSIMTSQKDLPLFVGAVRVGDSKKPNIPGKERVLIVGKYRLYFVSTKGKLRQAIHLLELTKIKSPNPAEVHLVFRNATLYLRSGVIDDIIAYIASAFQSHYFTITYKSEIVPENRVKALPPAEPAPCGAFGETYKAVAAFYSAPVREDLYWDVNNIYHINNVRTFDVGDFEGLTSQDIKILMITLNFNSNYFTGLKIKNYKLSSEQFQLIGDCLPRVPKLEKLVLDNNNPALKDTAVCALADSLAKGKNTSLTSLNISNNGIDEKSAKALGRALLSGNCPLQRLRMRNWGAASVKAIGAFFSDLRKNPKLAQSLTKLDLANSKLADDACMMLASFLSSAGNLLELNVSNSSANLEAISEALPIGCSRLQTLIFSGNKFNPKKEPTHMLSFLSATASLISLNLSNTAISVETLKAVLKAISSNFALQNLQLNLSENKLGALAANLIAHMAADFVNLEMFDLTDTDLGDEGVAYVVEGLCKSKSIRSLKIGRNMKQKSKYRQQAVKNIVGLLDSTCPIVSLSLEGSQLGLDISPLLLALGANETLMSLDISGNAVGNKGAFMLAKALQVNQSLKRLWIDDNQITLSGYQVLASALERNDTLDYIASPVLDLSAALRTDDHKSLLRVWAEIERSLHVNCASRAAATAVAELTAGTGTGDAPGTGIASSSSGASKSNAFRKSMTIKPETANAIIVASSSSSNLASPITAKRSGNGLFASPQPSQATHRAAGDATSRRLSVTPGYLDDAKLLELARGSRVSSTGAAVVTSVSATQPPPVLRQSTAGSVDDFAAAAQEKAARKKKPRTSAPGQRRSHRPQAPTIVSNTTAPEEGSDPKLSSVLSPRAEDE